MGKPFSQELRSQIAAMIVDGVRNRDIAVALGVTKTAVARMVAIGKQWPAICLSDISRCRYTVDENGCWIWGGRLSPAGYGRIRFRGKQWLLHRLFYVAHVGQIPDGLVIDHLCRVRCCVNPAHMEPVTAGENTRRGLAPSVSLGRRTHCSRGHEYTEKTTYIRRRSGKSIRVCRPCENQRLRK